MAKGKSSKEKKAERREMFMNKKQRELYASLLKEQGKTISSLMEEHGYNAQKLADAVTDYLRSRGELGRAKDGKEKDPLSAKTVNNWVNGINDIREKHRSALEWILKCTLVEPKFMVERNNTDTYNNVERLKEQNNLLLKQDEELFEAVRCYEEVRQIYCKRYSRGQLISIVFLVGLAYFILMQTSRFLLFPTLLVVIGILSMDYFLLRFDEQEWLNCGGVLSRLINLIRRHRR